MKGINISCTSMAATAIASSTEHPSSSSSGASTSAASGGRAIDRHNPIIRDGRRALTRSSPLPSPVSSAPQPQTTPKPSQEIKRGKKKSNVKKMAVELSKSAKTETYHNHGHDQVINSWKKQNGSKPSDLVLRGCTVRPGVDYISPPESSRFLLDDPGFLDGLPDFDPGLTGGPYDLKKADAARLEGGAASEPPPPPPSASSSPQVVVLRVSLHCKGCEGKVRKHLSRMEGVTSFNIDFKAKKVTVVGDVTPLGVLSSISKVKSAQLWTPTLSSSSVASVSLRGMAEGWK